ncbi:hypothetical protein NHF50_12230 [Flavobacterium sp. NRK F10]|uniref:hypothetical protein n=1 Tax=Flavobacterium sp. NRK F10 TaxID=2954931 RepID=UPI0020909DB8|nr:hypothetical protein [Flavobacterium sp. NRK F10]MCO6175811.1 hypothetical protein [Flavobacterium sp. NRK F10]
MKKIFVLAIVFSLFSFSSENKGTSVVYVCGKSEIYHQVKSHAALKRCKSDITEMTEKEALDAGKRKCKCKG